MFTKILLIVLISAVLVQAQEEGQKIHLSPEQRKAFIDDVMTRLKTKLDSGRAKRSVSDVAEGAYNEVMDAVKDRLEERLEEGLNFSCIPFSGGF